MAVKKLETLSEGILSSGIFAVKFSAEWCGPCKALALTFPDITGAELFEVDIDKDFDALLRYGIRSVPTTIIFKDGEIVGRVAGNNVKGIQEVIDSI